MPELCLRSNLIVMPAVIAAAFCFAAQRLHAQVSVTLTPSVPSPAPVGTLVNWSVAVANPGIGTWWYRFATRGFGQPRRIVKDFGPDNTFEWAANEREGQYLIEVTARNRETGATGSAVAVFEALSNVTARGPVVKPTSHPLVMFYSAPACPAGAQMTVYFLSPDNWLQHTPAKTCDGVFSMNFLVAGLYPSSFYYVKHIINNRGAYTEGPLLNFISGAAPLDLYPVHQKVGGPSRDQARKVFLAGSLLRFVATDLDGNLIWYYPREMLFLTHPEPGGVFFGIHTENNGDQSRQILRAFDLTGMTVMETNAARINEQLAALGKRQINGFHHEARRLSNGNILTLAGVEQILTDVQGPGPVDVLGDMILVLNRNLEVIWTWDTFDHLDVKRLATQGEMCTPAACPPTFLSRTVNDWVHGNAVAETPDGNLIYSSRSQDWVIKIRYGHGYGDGGVIWKLGKDGDFRINSADPYPWFSKQHDPEFEADGTLTIFDNGNIRNASDPSANSRGQVYRLDEVNRVAELVLNADLGYYAFALGSAQRLDNGSYLFDVGYLRDGSAINVETDALGNTVWGLRGSAPVYRTFRLKDMYTP